MSIPTEEQCLQRGGSTGLLCDTFSPEPSWSSRSRVHLRDSDKVVPSYELALKPILLQWKIHSKAAFWNCSQFWYVQLRCASRMGQWLESENHRLESDCLPDLPGSMSESMRQADRMLEEISQNRYQTECQVQCQRNEFMPCRARLGRMRECMSYSMQYVH